MLQITPSKTPLKDKTLLFAIRIVHLSRYLTENKKEYVLAKQVLRAGTNPGAMVREANHAESGQDFIHKLSIAQKEISETLYWLELLWKSNYLSLEMYTSMHGDGEEILRMLKSAILTRMQNLAKKP